MNRLTELPTLKINPRQTVSFSYQGKGMTGLEGDTVATALYSNGVRLFGRSLKYHRPRGLYSLDGESANAFMEINGLANCQTGSVLLRQGMQVAPQNFMGSIERDWMSVLDKFSFAMPAGFYYKIMHKPYKLWPFFQNRVRAAAGMGKLKDDIKTGRCDEMHLNAEVCVIGGGPAGLSAALAAAETGVRVVLFEARPHLGGFYDWRTAEYSDGTPLYKRAADLAAQLGAMPNVRIYTNAFVNGLWGDNLVTAFLVGQPGDSYEERYVEVRANSVVVAAGATERPLIFEHNERPGVMQPASVHRLAKTYGILAGKKAVFSVGHDMGLEAAVDLHDLGMQIVAVADCRLEGQDPAVVQKLADRGVPYMPGWAACKARGSRHVKGVVLAGLNSPQKKSFDCDILAAAAGLTPVAGHLYVAQAKMAYDAYTNTFMPGELPPRVHAAGRVIGYYDGESIEVSGRIAGLSAAEDAGVDVTAELKSSNERLADLPGKAKGSRLVASPGIGKGGKSFICFDEDGTYKHIRQAHDAGFDMPELAKRYTAVGTGPSQGGVPGHNLPMLMAELKAPKPSVVHPTTVRPPVVPTRFTTYAGLGHQIFKRTPMQEMQEKSGAIFRRVGVWKRARYFSDDFSCREEILNVRRNVGIIDVSTLGKFRIFGPDAEKALNRVYVGDMLKVPHGKAKYSAMVNEDGNLMDDGVVTKIGENDYYFTTSTGRAGVTAEWFRYHTRYENWDFNIVNLTDAMGAVNIAGPNARKVLEKLTEDDVSNEAFPFMGYREITLGGIVPARIMRLGFVGELSYELHIPSSCAGTVWEWFMEAGEEFGVKPFGLEAQSVLRLEKGHVIIGQESEIRTTLHDLGLGFLWHRNKPEAKTVGAPALKITREQENRLKLVGFQMDDSSRTPGDGSLIVEGDKIMGHVCTARYSYTLDQSIGLALVEDSLAEEGTTLKIFQDGMGAQRLNARVVATPFYDPEGERMKM